MGGKARTQHVEVVAPPKLILMRTAITLLAILAATTSAHPQWTLETSNTTTDLRGIHSLGGGVAWASGTNGTVLRTEDGGYVWQSCTVPPGAEKLDFRGIQAFDANTAIVMSSGPGDLSRLYKTRMGAIRGSSLFTNPDKDGFWDSFETGDAVDPLQKNDERERALILGDSVDRKTETLEWKEGREERELDTHYQIHGKSSAGRGSFAASNSVLQIARTASSGSRLEIRGFVLHRGTTQALLFLNQSQIEHTDKCDTLQAE